MSTLRKWFLSLLVITIMAVPVMAGSDDGKAAKENAASASASAAAEPIRTRPRT